MSAFEWFCIGFIAGAFVVGLGCYLIRVRGRKGQHGDWRDDYG